VLLTGVFADTVRGSMTVKHRSRSACVAGQRADLGAFAHGPAAVDYERRVDVAVVL
jgi:hypothetical protein